jgi:peptidase E
METEAKEEGLDVVSHASASLPESPEPGADELVEEVHETDYSRLTKKELVDLLKDMVRDNDFLKSDASLRELRSRFEDLQHLEKTEALKRFLENGGTLDDFDYRLDALDIAFEANFKLLRNKRLEHFRNIEQQKNENLAKKKELLDTLRQLIDGKDDKHAFDKFKEIQKQWREIGPVPAAQVRPTWASYHALVDRFFDNRNIYFELKELDRKKNLEAKLELCGRAEKLAEEKQLGVALRELHELHEEYKHIGPVPRDEKDALWDRFRKATDAVYERRDAAVATQHAEWTKNLELKQELIRKVTELAAFQSDRIKEWNQKTQEILAIQKAWEEIGGVARSKSKDVNKQFWSAFKSFFATKSKFFSKLEGERKANLEKKRELVKHAEELKENKDWDKTSAALRALQAQWKEIGPVPDRFRESIYAEFKAACDHFFGQRRERFEAADKEQADNLAKKEALCTELEQMTAAKTATLDVLKEKQRAFQAIGFVPRAQTSSIKAKFSQLFQQAMGTIEVSQTDKDRAMMELQVENLKSDPDAAYKLQQRELGLRKRIQKEENDIALLKNNLEFFGRSKNAEKMKAEFSEKIATAEAEIAGLKRQLKELRAVLRG